MAKKAMWQHLENVKQKLFELSDVDDPNFDGYLFNMSPIVEKKKKTIGVKNGTSMALVWTKRSCFFI